MTEMRKRKILIICTGGTIASRQKENGLAPDMDAQELLGYIPSLENRYELKALQLCSIDSTNMTPEYWSMIVRTIKQNYFDYDGFVICHGTDTMAYTSAALSYMIQNSVKPVVITGAQKPIDLAITDAKTNLMDSIMYAADPASHGVVIVFGGTVIAGTRAKKIRALSYNAFESVNYPALAVIQNGRIFRYLPEEQYREAVRFTEEISDSIVILKLSPASRPEILEYLFQHYDCIVIESFGVGGIPSRLMDEFYQQMNKWVSQGKIIVIATQVVNEGSNMEIYEVGQKIKRDFSLIESFDMTLEAVMAKLMYLMSVCDKDYGQIRTHFYQCVNHDILCTYDIDGSAGLRECDVRNNP